MSAMHYVTISGLHNSYRVEIGYFQPFRHLAFCRDVGGGCDAAAARLAKLADVDLATIPFHLGFQQLANLFGVGSNDMSGSGRHLSEFQKRHAEQRQA